MMAKSRAESTRDTYNYGQYINQFPPNMMKAIREYERIQKKIYRQKMSIMFPEICIYIYIYICVCVCVCNYIYIYIYVHNGILCVSIYIYTYQSCYLSKKNFCSCAYTKHFSVPLETNMVHVTRETEFLVPQK